MVLLESALSTQGSSQRKISVPEYAQYAKMQSRTQIRKNYLQEKFSLMREESEGYSKLIVLLLQDAVDLKDKISAQVQQVMHEFNLETNRTIDIILECMESLLIQKVAN